MITDIMKSFNSMVQSIFETTFIYGMRIDYIMERLVNASYGGNPVFSSTYEKAAFMLWYARTALEKGKFNNSNAALKIAKNYLDDIIRNSIMNPDNIDILPNTYVMNIGKLRRDIKELEYDCETFALDISSTTIMSDDELYGTIDDTTREIPILRLVR